MYIWTLSKEIQSCWLFLPISAQLPARDERWKGKKSKNNFSTFLNLCKISLLLIPSSMNITFISTLIWGRSDSQL